MSNTSKFIFAVLALLTLPFVAHANPANSIPQVGGDIHVIHPNGNGFWLTATTSTALGKGIALMTAYNYSSCGDVIILASSTNPYNINQGVLDLTKGHTCATGISLIGLEGKTPEIDGGNTNSYYVIEIGNGTLLKNLTIRGTQVFGSDYSFPIVVNSNNITAAIRYVNVYGTTDGIYAINVNTGINLTIDHLFCQSNWDCVVFDNPGSIVNIYDSNITIATPPAVGGTLRPFLFGRGVYNLYNTKIQGQGGTSAISAIQMASIAGPGDSVNFYSGNISAVGSANSYEFENLSVTGGTIYIGPAVQWTPASTTGTISYSTSTVAAFYTAKSTTASSTFANGLNLTKGCFAVNSVCVGSGTGSGTVNTGVFGQAAFYGANGTTVSGTSTLTIGTTTLDANNVGVGTTSPSSKLTVNPGAGTKTTLSLYSGRVNGDISLNQDILRFNTLDGLNLGTIDYLGRWFANPGNLSSFGPTAIDASMQVSTRNSGASGFIIRGANGQTANLIDVQDYTGVDKFHVGSAGEISANGGKVTTDANTGALLITSVDNGGSIGANGLTIDASALSGIGAGICMAGSGNTVFNCWQMFDKGGNNNFFFGRANIRDNMVIGGAQASVFFPGPNSGVGLPSGSYSLMASAGTDATYVPMIAIGASAQTADLFEVQNSSSVVLSEFDKNGHLGLASTSPWGTLSVEMDTTNPAFVVANQGSSTPAFIITGVNQNGRVGFGTTTPFKPYVFVAPTATTTIVHGDPTHQSCDQYYSPNGTAYRTYMSNAGGLVTEAGICQ